MTESVDDLFDIDRARTLSVQAGDKPDSAPYMFRWFVRGSHLIPGWWSPERDTALRRFWKLPDHLAGAIYTMTSKMTAIPFRVIPVDPSNQKWVAQADERARALRTGAEFGEGWQQFYSKWIEDLITQDNGAFAEIIGPGDPTGPLTGAPITIAHLDSNRCSRTGDPEYPVVYMNTDGKQYKMHYTRVMFASQMTSPIKSMNGVGFSAVSRCINVAQNLLDILTFKQEKLGSRPHRFVMVTQGGLDPDDIRTAFRAAGAEMDSRGLSRYSQGVVVGHASITAADVKLIELAGLPDGFDEQTSTELGMATIALALGVDARELFPSLSSGATRADALLQHLKQRGKGPGQIIQTVEQMINYKFLPPHLTISFDFQDDAEDRQSAEISQTRSQKRERDILSGVMDVRVARQGMVKDNEIDQVQFEDMELADGRLVDGSSIFSLFYNDPELDMGVKFPDNPRENDPIEMLDKIAKKRSEINQMIAGEKSHEKRRLANRSLAALTALEKLYAPFGMMPIPGEEDASMLPDGMEGDRMPASNLLRPNPAVELSLDQENMKPGKDEDPNTATTTKGHPSALALVVDSAIERIKRIGRRVSQEDESEAMETPMGVSKQHGNEIEMTGKPMTVETVFRPVIRLQVPDAPAVHNNVTVNFPTEELKEIIAAAKSGMLEKEDARTMIELLGEALRNTQEGQATIDLALQTLKEGMAAKEAPIVNVTVPAAQPTINVAPVLQMPDTEETTEVVHDARGRITKMFKRITARSK